MYQGKYSSKNNKEYSKKIVYWTGILFVSQLIMSIYFSYKQYDTSIFVYTIPATAGVFGAAIIFYLNKAKLENSLKIKIAYTKFKLRVSQLIPPEAMDEVNNEFMILEESISGKIDNTIIEAINEDITHQSY